MLDRRDLHATPIPTRRVALVERAVRAFLPSLSEGEVLSTVELARRLLPDGNWQPSAAPIEAQLIQDLLRLGRKVPGLAVRLPPEIATAGFLKGREIRRLAWRRIEPSAMPVRRDVDSSGAAGVGLNLVERVEALERWVAMVAPKLEGV